MLKISVCVHIHINITKLQYKCIFSYNGSWFCTFESIVLEVFNLCEVKTLVLLVHNNNRHQKMPIILKMTLKVRFPLII